MESWWAIVLKHALVVVAGVAVAALAAVLPAIPHGGATGWATLALAATVILGIVELARGERPNVARVPLTAILPIAGLAAAAGYLLSWLAVSPVPLAVAGGVLAGVGLERLVALAVGRASRDLDEPPPRVETEASDAVVIGWMALGAIDIAVLAAAAGGRVSFTGLLIVAAATGLVAPAIWAIGERLARARP